MNAISSIYKTFPYKRGNTKIRNLNATSDTRLEPHNIRKIYKQNLKVTRLAYVEDNPDGVSKYNRDKDVRIEAKRCCSSANATCWHRTRGSRERGNKQLCKCYRLPHGKSLTFVH